MVISRGAPGGRCSVCVTCVSRYARTARGSRITISVIGTRAIATGAERSRRGAVGHSLDECGLEVIYPEQATVFSGSLEDTCSLAASRSLSAGRVLFMHVDFARESRRVSRGRMTLKEEEREG